MGVLWWQFCVKDSLVWYIISDICPIITIFDIFFPVILLRWFIITFLTEYRDLNIVLWKNIGPKI